MEYSCQTYQLKCNECGRTFGNRPLSGCPDCLAPLEIHYDLEAIRKTGRFTREAIAAGPFNIWRYAALLPIPAGFEPDLPVGSPRSSARRTSASASAQTISTSRTTPSASPRSPSRTASSRSPSPMRRPSASPPSAALPPGILQTLSPPRPRALASRPPSSCQRTSSPPRSSTPSSTARASSASTATTTTSTASPPRSPTSTTGLRQR